MMIGETLANIPMLRIRAFLGRVYQRRWEAGAVEAAFPGLGEEILEALLDEGYAQPTSEAGIYKTTLKGDLLVEAAGLRTVSRNERRKSE